MKWKPFHLENASTVTFLGFTWSLLFGHSPKGEAILTLIVNRKTWAKALQLGV
jgi:hypothetical protein